MGQPSIYADGAPAPVDPLDSVCVAMGGPGGYYDERGRWEVADDGEAICVVTMEGRALCVPIGNRPRHNDRRAPGMPL
jgi:hypothetical protein